MSDYLWDKTGEPDAEVARLEQLLGALRHEPRPLELPPAARVEQTARRRLLRPALAIAATIALILLAGFVALRRGGHEQRVAQNSQPPAPQQHAAVRESERDATAHEPNNPDGRSAGAEEEENFFPRQAKHKPPIRRQRRAAADESAGLSRRSRRGGARAPLAAPPRDDVLTAVRHRQQAAKEQLVYALRLTSAKLNEVQTMVSGAGEEGTPGEVRNKIR